MEIKINKEIRSYKETVYFGLTARQLICSLLAVGTAVGLLWGGGHLHIRHSNSLWRGKV